MNEPRVNKTFRNLTALIPLLVLGVLLVAGGTTSSLRTSAQSNPDSVMYTVEAKLVEVKPDSPAPLLIEYTESGEPVQVWCKATSTTQSLLMDSSLEPGCLVLAAVSPDSGVVIDMIVMPDQPQEPEPPVDDPVDDPPVDPPVDDPVDPPVDPAPAVPLPPGVTLVPGVAPGPTPGLTAPEGKVKLTVLALPSTADVSTYPPSGVYFVDVDTTVLFKCFSEDPQWSFTHWYVAKGSSGGRVKPGIGPEFLTTVKLNADAVVTAYHSEVIN